MCSSDIQKRCPSPRRYQAFKQDATEIEATIEATLDWEDQGQGKYRIIARKSFPDVADPKYRAAILTWLRDMTNRFITVFRPRLERLVCETR
jgi:hypothetical protein